MPALLQRDLEWTGQAPYALEGTMTTSASPEAVFAILADHERWPEWFPNVTKVVVLGPAEGVGARRRVKVPGASFDEEFIAWEPGVRWAFTGFAAKPAFVRSLVEDCRITVAPDGRTAVSYTMYLDPKGWARPFMPVAARRVRTSIGKAMQNLAERAERA